MATLIKQLTHTTVVCIIRNNKQANNYGRIHTVAAI